MSDFTDVKLAVVCHLKFLSIFNYQPSDNIAIFAANCNMTKHATKLCNSNSLPHFSSFCIISLAPLLRQYKRKLVNRFLRRRLRSRFLQQQEKLPAISGAPQMRFHNPRVHCHRGSCESAHTTESRTICHESQIGTLTVTYNALLKISFAVIDPGSCTLFPNAEDSRHGSLFLSCVPSVVAPLCSRTLCTRLSWFLREYCSQFSYLRRSASFLRRSRGKCTIRCTHRKCRMWSYE